MRSRVWIIAVVLALLVVAAAGCGGDDDDSGGAATTAATTAETTEGGADGAAVFASACGTCHTLAAAGSDGTTGPNLDDLMPDEETVEAQVRAAAAACRPSKGN